MVHGLTERTTPARLTFTCRAAASHRSLTDQTDRSTAWNCVALAHDLYPTVRNLVRGQVIAPNDAAYDAARTVFMGDVDRRPAVIVRPADAADVSRVVSLARESGLELAVRSGGHSGAGHSVSEGGIVLDLAHMRGLEIDVERRTAWAETGLTAGEYSVAAAEHGLATGFGDTGSVGIGGITLGGGVGYLARKHGLTIDDLLAADVVTADGKVLRADPETHPDLFWAIRGGGGNFGVATRLQFRLHPVGTVTGGMLVLPATPDVIRGFIAEAEAAPEELSTIANVMPAPPMPFVPEEHHGKLVILAMLVHAGAVEAGRARGRAVARARAADRRPGPADAVSGDLSARRGRLPSDSSRAHDVHRRGRPRRGGDDRPSSCARPTRRCAWHSSGCSAVRWRASLTTRLRSRTAGAGSWSTSPRSTRAPRTGLCARPG